MLISPKVPFFIYSFRNRSFNFNVQMHKLLFCFLKFDLCIKITRKVKTPCTIRPATRLGISLYWLVSRRPVELRKFCVVELHKPNIRRTEIATGARHDIVGWQLLLAAVSAAVAWRVQRLRAHTDTACA